MPSNIEIKARVEDLEKIEASVERFADGKSQVIRQEDVFFRCERGRLKLRIFDDCHGELIWYDRPDSQEAKRSDYRISRTEEPGTLRETLTRAYGELVVVRKVRTLYMIGQTRVHLDRVEQLGDFVELEVVLQADQTDEAGQHIASQIMQDLGIESGMLVGGAYADLLMARR